MIQDLFRRELVFAELDTRTRDDALAQLARHVADSAPGVNGAALLRTLKDREAQATTAFGDGVAIPHARLPGLAGMVVAFARSRAGIEWNAPDRQPVSLILMLAGPADKPDLYLKTLASASRLLRDVTWRTRLLAAESDEELFDTLRTAGDEHNRRV